jgi:regulator of protease activity HflC (stomatin/prohibitin superfamily)
VKKFFFAFMAVAALLLGGCTRIETGEVGMRINFDKTINTTELQPGTWNQIIIGEVLNFKVKDLPLVVDNLRPLTSENTALADLDLTVVYGINPAAVAELYTTKSRAFHVYDDKAGDMLLMYSYMDTLVRNAAYKAVRGYKSLAVADNRPQIEQTIKDLVLEQLRSEKLDSSIHLTVVQVRNVQPDPQILQAASALVRAETELRQKTVEVQTAAKEAERMQALSSNSANSIAFMNAQSTLNISEGIKSGKVHTIVVPADFRGMVNVGSR